MIKKMPYHRVRLRPIAKELNGEAAVSEIDDEWIIEQIGDSGVTINNPRTRHSKLLGFDHIHNYKSDPSKDFDGLKHGFLVLTVQLILDGWHVHVEPILLNNRKT
jgi:hypothetical protein